MKNIFRKINSSLIIGVIGFLLISLLIWFAGPSIKFGESNNAPLSTPISRLFIITLLLVIWLAKIVISQLISNKNNTRLVHELRESQIGEHDGYISDQSLEEISQINDRFDSALKTLTSLSSGLSKKGKALYQLPWYIIIGPPGAGKTSTLANSGLEFPLADNFGSGALEGVGGTRNCDWWFTNDAVLIDTAGRYTTQDSHKTIDSRAWDGFLSLLKRNRPRRPINGVIVSISLQDLLIQNEEERLLHAKTIRMRIDELMDKLEIRFPVYVIFTKVDLIPGFCEFFEDLTKDERDQVFGVSLPNASADGQTPDFAFFKKEFKSMLSRFHKRVIFRLHQERDHTRCSAIENFPLQMELGFKLAESFLKNTFNQNRFKQQPYLRGAYFSSANQNGTPIDRLMAQVSSNFGLSKNINNNTPYKGRAYFIHRLFNEVIFPESELVGTNQRYERLVRTTRAVGYAAAGIIGLGTILLWSGFATRSNLLMQDVNAHVMAYKSIDITEIDARQDYQALLLALNQLMAASQIHDQNQYPRLSGFGLYDGRVDESAKKLYLDKLEKLFTPFLIYRLENDIKKTTTDHDLYQLFRIYRMFDRTDKIVYAELQLWFENLVANDNSFSEHKEDWINHFHNWQKVSLNSSSLNQTLVDTTRAQLLDIPVAQRIYRQIKSDQHFSRKVSLKQQLGQAAYTLFDLSNPATLEVPYLFTLQGYHSLDLSIDSSYFSSVGDDDWVFHDRDQAQIRKLDNPDQVQKEVTQIYLNEYSEVWKNLLSSIKVKKMNNLQDLSNALQLSIDPINSPLVRILELTREHTQLSNTLLQDAANKVKDGSKLDKSLSAVAKKIQRSSVDEQFSNLHHLVYSNGQSIAPITLSLQQINGVNSFVQEINLSPNVGQQSFEIAKARFQSNVANPISNLRIQAKSNPDVVKNWLTQIADESWRLVMQSAHAYVNQQWQEVVFRPYQQGLAGRYPLFENSSDEIALMDFSAFFKPGGILKSFERDYLLPFIEKRNQWSNKSVEGYSLGISNKLLKELQRAQKIGEIYFKEDPSNPSFSLDLKPYFMSKDDAIFSLDLGDQRLSYSHGPKLWRSLKFFSKENNQRVRLVFQDISGKQETLEFSGPWAWFKLMDAANIEPTPQSNIYRISFLSNEDKRSQTRKKVIFEGRTTSVNNPFKNELLTSFRCPETI